MSCALTLGGLPPRPPAAPTQNCSPRRPSRHPAPSQRRGCRPPRGPGAQGGRCQGARAGEAERIGPDRRAAGVGTALPPVSALSSRAPGRRPGPSGPRVGAGGYRAVRSALEPLRSRQGRRAERPLGSGSGARFTSVLPPPELGEGRRGVWKNKGKALYHVDQCPPPRHRPGPPRLRP